MRLAIVLTQPFWYDGKQYTTKYPFALFIIKLAKHIDSLVLFVPLKLSTSERGEHLVSLYENVTIVSYPFCSGLKEQYLYAHRILPEFIRVIIVNRKLFDVCGFVSTNLLSFTGYAISKFYSKKVFIYLRANIRKAYSIQINSIVGKITGTCLGYLEELFCRIMTKFTPTFVIGNELFNKYKGRSKSLHLFYSNLISEKQIEYLKDSETIGDNSLKLLSVGRLVPQKGMEYLIDAIDELVNRKGYSPACYIAGSGIEDKKLQTLVNQKKLSAYFHFLGDIPWSETLFQLYRKCDFYILSSLTEGFPKTIFEAMAFGLPVISTDVGGISSIIKSEVNGMLVQPKSSSEIVSAINKIWNNETIYNRIVENGYKTVRQFTIENQHIRLVSLLKQEFEGNRKTHNLV